MLNWKTYLLLQLYMNENDKNNNVGNECEAFKCMNSSCPFG